MTAWRRILVIALYVIGVSFCLNWQPWRAVLAFAPWPLILLGLVWIVWLFLESASGLGGRMLRRLLDLPARSWVIACGLLTTGGALFMAYGPLEAIPHVPDDICYLWQARTFALGRLYMDSHELKEFFHLLFMVNDGKWYSLFQPGWPALLSLGVFGGLEFAVNPILGGIATMLVYPIGRRVFDARTAKAGMLLLTLSPMHLAISATLLAHPLAFVLTELAILATLRLIETNRLHDALLLGLSLGWLFTTRALNGIATLGVVAIPLVVFMLRGKVSFTKLLAGVPIAFLFLALQLAYNDALTGDPLYWPQDRYFDLSESKKGCHSLGFGTKVGCPGVHPGRYFPEGFTPWDAFGVFHERMGTFMVTLFGFQLVFLFLGAPFLANRFGWRKLFLLSVFLSLLIAYFFWYFHGLWGRYYYEAAFALFLLIAAGMAATHAGIGKLAVRLPRKLAFALKGFVPAVAITYVIFNAVVFLPYATHEILAQAFFSVDSRLSRVENDIPKKSVIFLEDWYQLGFIVMRPGLPQQKLFVKDLGKKHNRLIMQMYPDWNYYSYAAANDRLTKIKRKVPPAPIFVELEWKVLNGLNSGDFATYEPFTAENGERASNNFALVYNADAPGDWTAFKQMVFEDGDYRLRLHLPSGPDRGILRVAVDGTDCGETVDTYSAGPGFVAFSPSACGRLALSRGMHEFRFTVVGKNPASSGYRLGADLMTLERVRSNGP